MQKIQDRRRVAALFMTAALVAALTVPVATALDSVSPRLPAASAAPVAGGLGFVALSAPCRAIDTRSAGGALLVGTTRAFKIGGAGSLAGQGGNGAGCGVPDGVGAVEVALTAVNPTGNGFLRAGPNGTPPTATVINYTSGTSITNTVTVPLAPTGTEDLAVANLVGSTQLVVDVLGYFTTPTGNGYVALPTACRAVDTRSATLGPLVPGTARNVQIAGSGSLAAQGGSATACGVPDGVPAVHLSISAVGPSGNGFLRAGPNSGTPPTATVVNFTNGVSITNSGSVPLSQAEVPAADLTLLGQVATTNVTVDVLGYFTPSGGTRYQTVTPCRAVDTRSAPGGTVVRTAARTFQISGGRANYLAQGSNSPAGCGVPQRAAAVEAAVTAVGPESGGFTQLTPTSTQTGTTFVNFTAGRSITNAGVVTLAKGTLQELIAQNVVGASHLVVDVLGYYEPTDERPFAIEDADVGERHACAVVAMGTVKCWGDNTFGKLGDGTTSDRSTPVRVDGIALATSVSTGPDHTCAVVESGQVKCWGSNSFGQLGDGTTTPRKQPVTVTGISDAVEVSAGGDHTCALLENGSVKCWGGNGTGQLGDGTTTTRLTPTPVINLGSAAAIATGGSHSCALQADSVLKCWGLNNRGQIGDGTTTNRPTPAVVGGLGRVLSVDAGLFHTCVVVVDTSARCWGAGDRGQLGNGTTVVSQSTPVTVTGLSRVLVLSIGAGGLHSCATVDNGNTKCWGSNSSRQLGDGTATNRSLPTAVVDSRVGLMVAAGDENTCGFGVDGASAYCWGSGAGAIGNGTSSANGVAPASVLGYFGPFGATPVAIAAGGDSSCALRTDGTAKCWGYNDGIIPADPGHERTTPVIVSGLSNLVAVDTDETSTCGLRADGTVKCRGFNSSGQVGDGTFAFRSQPVSVSGLSTAVTVSVGPLHTCSAMADGTAKCWGRNGDGQLGNGSSSNSNVPVTVSGLTNVVDVQPGGFHTCALLTDATVKCWGNNSWGQLGNGTTTASSTPVTVAGLSNVAAIAVGGYSVCALIGDGSVKCLGNNEYGQLGNGSTTDSSTPVAASSLSSVVEIAASAQRTCAVRESGAALCWGRNVRGGVGDGTTTNRTVPTAVTGSSNVVSVASGASHSCFFGPVAVVKCWGGNDFGALGIGSLTDSLTPAALNASG